MSSAKEMVDQRADGGGPMNAPHVGEAIVFHKPKNGALPPPPDANYRAVHQVRLAALSHNYSCVESAATRQRCSVIVVVKADGYGHGAIESAVHLADSVGADAFAVATLEEGIALRKAFENTPPAHPTYSKSGSNVESRSQSSSTSSPTSSSPKRSMRPPQIRILVLGPPVGFPRCFDDYFHYGIEVMCSGPEVAKALIEWLSDDKERKRTQVERAANDAKAAALVAGPSTWNASVSNEKSKDVNGATPTSNNRKKFDEKSRATSIPVNETEGNTDGPPLDQPAAPAASVPAPQNQWKEPSLSATLGNVSGQDLAKEVKAYLMTQQKAKDATNHIKQYGSSADNSVAPTVTTAAFSQQSSIATNGGRSGGAAAPTAVLSAKGQVFGGIEAAAKTSRTREMAAARVNGVFREDSGVSEVSAAAQSMTIARKRLRYHILVDSGMGRLGFKTQLVEASDVGYRRDTVDIIHELVDLEVAGAPVEFYGMCTHMADASSTSDYTQAQMNRFKGLLKRVRAAGISIPTVSTDNSAALLTTTLTHFDAKTILAQSHTQTRGFVRTGGAIYGQRPAFKQLKAVSTLLASVRHVAILKQSESVGYDRAYIAPYNVRIATLTVGFADGYPRELGNGTGKVAIRGHLFPVAGNVCMDMLMVELGPASDKTGIGAQICVGDTAVLWGPLDENDGDGMVRLQDIASTLKTTQSALTCGLDKIRVLRQYV